MKITLVLAAIASVGMANANSLSTIFTGGNSNVAGGGNYFTATVAANPISVTGFEVNANAVLGTNFGFEVYTCLSSHVGNELIPGNWTLRASGSGTSVGVNLPTLVTITAPFQLDPGAVGMAIFLRGGPGAASLSYTNGNGSNQNYSNADLALALGTSSNGFFTPSIFTPRVWNGTINYDVVPEPASLVALGLGAAALIRRRRKSA